MKEEMYEDTLPVADWETPDDGYLAEALARAGRPVDSLGPVHAKLLDGGRTGARVSHLQCADGSSFVLKAIPCRRGFREALGHDGEAAAWLRGAMDGLPPPLATPVLDATLNPARAEWWLLMEDVSSGIVSRADWREDHSRRLFEAMAGLHAKHWDCESLRHRGLGALADTTALPVEIALYEATGVARTPWAVRAAEEFQVPRILLPEFLEAAGPADADFYLMLLRCWPDLVAALEQRPPTVLHGDLRRANIAFLDGRLVLFDWEFAATGPAAVDLTWHWFLHYWAYPPDDGRHPDDRLWLRDHYLQHLEDALGRPVASEDFRDAWELGWLRVFAQLGFVLADGLGGETYDARIQMIRNAFDRARRIADEQLAS